MSTYYRDGEQQMARDLRRDALSLAEAAWRDYKLFPNSMQKDQRTGRIIETAKAFEEFLLGKHHEPTEAPDGEA